MKILFLALLLNSKLPIVQATELYDYYIKQGEKKGNEKYQDKRFVITGKVRYITPSYYVYLIGNKDGDVIVSLKSTEFVKVWQLKENDTFTAECTGAGLVFKEPILLDCIVL